MILRTSIGERIKAYWARYFYVPQHVVITRPSATRPTREQLQNTWTKIDWSPLIHSPWNQPTALRPLLVTSRQDDTPTVPMEPMREVLLAEAPISPPAIAAIQPVIIPLDEQGQAQPVRLVLRVETPVDNRPPSMLRAAEFDIEPETTTAA